MREKAIEFKQGCEGLCTVGGACFLLGRWLEQNFTSEDCELNQYRIKNIDYCTARITNKPVADIMWQRKDLRKWVSYERLLYVMGIQIECSRTSLSLDAPVPEEETEYWENRVKKLSEEIETFYAQPVHEHIAANHIHAFYRNPTLSGFKKFTRLVMDLLSPARPKIKKEQVGYIKG